MAESSQSRRDAGAFGAPEPARHDAGAFGAAGPRIVGRYAVYEEIASGGMGAVHYGRLLGAVGFARTVAIKRLHTERGRDPNAVTQFVDEARLAARVRHPNVVPTLDVVAVGGGELLIVMEYVHGEPLSRLLTAAVALGRPTPPDIASALLGGVLHGLHAAHEAKDEQGQPLTIIHRDVSPQNVLVGADGMPRVVDFGVAKASSRLGESREGELKGKLAYMPPELFAGKEPDRRVDVFGAGVVLWEALTLKRLFGGGTEADVVKNVLEKPIERPGAIVAGLPGAIDEVVMRAVDREPGARFLTAREMALALDAAVPAASVTRVAAWVEELAGSSLARRAHAVEAIERHSAGAPDAAMERLAGGDEAAFADLFDLLAPRLFDYIVSRMADGARTEAVVKQTLLTMHAARGAFPAGAAAAPWASDIAKRLADDAPTVERVDEAPTQSMRSDEIPPFSLRSEARLDALGAAQAQRSPTREELQRQTLTYAAVSLVVACSLLEALLAYQGERVPAALAPTWFLAVSTLGWFAAAVAATWGAFVRGPGDISRPRAALVAVAGLTPVLTFAWMRLVGASCPVTFPHLIGWKCTLFTLAAAAPPLFLLLRARRASDPLHPGATGAALGAAAGAWAGVIVNLWCPIPYAAHLLVGHVGPIVILSIAGALFARAQVGVAPLGSGPVSAGARLVGDT